MRTAHCIDYSSSNLKIDGAAACQREIVDFVRGVRGPRSAPVSAADICSWFKATPKEFVQQQIDAALSSGSIRIVQASPSSTRRYNGSYRYEITSVSPEDERH